MKNKKCVLNVGGGPSRNLPPYYDNWEQHLLDIDKNVNPDICCDARELQIQDVYDAVYTSHTLEHFYKHEIPLILSNIYNCLKNEGTLEIHVPDIKDLISRIGTSSLDIHDVYYRLSDGNPITYHDVLYGWNYAMSNGNLYYAHKCGFTPISLYNNLAVAGFKDITIQTNNGNICSTSKKIIDIL